MRIKPFIFGVLLVLAGCKSPIQDVPPSPTKAVSIMPQMALAVNSLAVAAPITETDAVSLAWSPGSDPGVTGYKIYYGTNSGVYFASVDAGAATSAIVSVVSLLDANVEWFFVATAYAPSGFGTNIESAFSNEAHWPAYPPIITGFHLSGNGLVHMASDLIHWQDFTNTDTNGIDLPYEAGAKFFSGTNLTLKPVFFYPQ